MGELYVVEYVENGDEHHEVFFDEDDARDFFEMMKAEGGRVYMYTCAITGQEG